MLPRKFAHLAAPLLLLAFAVAADAQLLDPRSQPEASTGLETHELATSKRHMVSATNGYAADAGREILRAGGSAVDAAIATQFVLNLVEPQSSGIGGGAFVLYWDTANAELKVYDGRETAPASAHPDRFLVDGKPMPFDQRCSLDSASACRASFACWRPCTSGTGACRGRGCSSRRSALPNRASTCRRGCTFCCASTGPIASCRRRGATSSPERAMRWPIGYLFKNPELAATLRALRRAARLRSTRDRSRRRSSRRSRAAPIAVGGMTLDDLTGYAVKERTPVCITYRGHEVCGVGPPSSGGPTVAQTLKLVEPFDLGNGSDAALNAAAVHLIAEAEKLAYADRNRYIADPDFVAIPDGLLDDAYIAQRRALIDQRRAMDKPKAGEPPGLKRQSFGVDATVERAGTSHISIIDGDGNAVAMTTTIEGGFGSHNWAAGFLLNNELTDFSLTPVDAAGHPVANAVAPGKRPRSSMAPTIVFDEQRNVEAVLGSPGGSRIILYVVKALVALLDWRLDAQTAADLLNFGSQGSGFEIELDWPAVPLALTLRPLGHRIVPSLMNSGIHIVTRRDGHLEGAADARREGAALGD